MTKNKKQSVTEAILEQARDDGLNPEKLLLFKKDNPGKRSRSTKKKSKRVVKKKVRKKGSKK